MLANAVDLADIRYLIEKMEDPLQVCEVCNDRARKQHYGVLTCRGCRQFFKRIVRQASKPECSRGGDCPVDVRFWLECSACRYAKCIAKGMKPEAVTPPRQSDDGDQGDPTDVFDESSTSSDDSTATTVSGASSLVAAARSVVPHSPRLSIGHLLSAELRSGLHTHTRLHSREPPTYVDLEDNATDPIVFVCHAVEQQFPKMLQWAREVMRHANCPASRVEQFSLFRATWPELILLSAAFNSMAVPDGVLLSNESYLSRTKARSHPIGPLVERFLDELVARFRAIQFDRMEMMLLRAVILFNPEANNLRDRAPVEQLRESLCTALNTYSVTTHANEATRFSRIILRLSAIRDIAQKCLEHLLFSRYGEMGALRSQFMHQLFRDTFPQGPEDA